MREAGAGFGEPDELGQLRECHVAADLAVGVEERFGGQAAELETAAQSFDGFLSSPACGRGGITTGLPFVTRRSGLRRRSFPGTSDEAQAKNRPRCLSCTRQGHRRAAGRGPVAKSSGGRAFQKRGTMSRPGTSLAAGVDATCHLPKPCQYGVLTNPEKSLRKVGLGEGGEAIFFHPAKIRPERSAYHSRPKMTIPVISAAMSVVPMRKGKSKSRRCRRIYRLILRLSAWSSTIRWSPSSLGRMQEP